MARITPGGVSGLRRTLGALAVHPRLAARQRGILAFMPLTVVGPGRLDSGRRGCPRTARGRRLRKSSARRCRSRSPPAERLRKAPLELGSGYGSHSQEFTIRQVFFSEYILTR